jgi:amino acid transporter
MIACPIGGCSIGNVTPISEIQVGEESPRSVLCLPDERTCLRRAILPSTLLDSRVDLENVTRNEASSEPQAQARQLRRELRLADLVLMQVLLVTTETCIGIAARQGPTHVVFWVCGILLFFVPLAVVVRFLGSILPIEGGVYEWATVGLSPFFGFIAAWNFWIYSIFLTSSLGISIAESLSYAGGPSSPWMTTGFWHVTAVNLVVFSLILAVNVRGFRLGKWVSHAGTAAMLAVQLTIITLLFVRPHGQAPPQRPFSWTLPPLTIMSLNLLTKVTFTGLNGGEQIAVFAGEMRDPARSIGRSLWIAAPIIALLYILSTGSLLSYVPAAKIDLAAPVSQLLGAALGVSHSTSWIAVGGVSAIIALSIAQYTVIVAETSRLPLVAGWDGLLPSWFARLHSRHRTPTHALWFIVLCCFGLATVSLLGVARQEAFQLVVTAAQAAYGVYYLMLFAIPLGIRTSLPRQPGFVVRLCAGVGTAATLTAIAFQVLPVVGVGNHWSFGMKVTSALLLANLIGAFLYRRARRHGRTGIGDRTDVSPGPESSTSRDLA